MAIVHIRVNPTHPFNDPTNPLFRRNMVYSLDDVGIGNGMSWSYAGDFDREHSNGSGLTQSTWPRPAHLVVTATYVVEFNEEDVKRWNPQLKGLLAYYVDNGYLKVDIDSVGVGVTGNQIRTFS